MNIYDMIGKDVESEYDVLMPKLIEIRKRKISQKEAADALGLSIGQLCRIEKGKHKSLYVLSCYLDTFGGDLE